MICLSTGGTTVETANEELDSEAEEWAEQQMQKAMPAIADIVGTYSQSYRIMYILFRYIKNSD
jgi:hypothetical protein